MNIDNLDPVEFVLIDFIPTKGQSKTEIVRSALEVSRRNGRTVFLDIASAVRIPITPTDRVEDVLERINRTGVGAWRP